MTLFKTNSTKDYYKTTRVKKVFGALKKSRRSKRKKKKKKKIGDNAIKHKPLRVGCFYSNNYIKYESNSYRNNIKEYLDEIKPYLKKYIIKNLEKFGTWKIQITIINRKKISIGILHTCKIMYVTKEIQTRVTVYVNMRDNLWGTVFWIEYPKRRS